MTENNSSAYSSQVIDMLTVAAQYCVFLEKLATEGTTRHQFLDQVTKFLPLIYVKAALLPDLSTLGDADVPEVVTEDDYEDVRKAIWQVLKADDEYLEVFTPDMQYSEGPMTRTISEDLADIYQDLKNFVAVYAQRNEEAMQDAVAKVRENFCNYWGQRLVNAMRPMHELLYNSNLTDEDEDDADTTNL